MMLAASRTIVSWCRSMSSLLPGNLLLKITGASGTLICSNLKPNCVLRHCSLLQPLPPKRSQNSWRMSSYQRSMSLLHCANSNVGRQRTLHGGCRQQPLTLNVHAGVSNGNGAVISKSQTGLRIVVRAVLLVNSFRPLVVTIFSKNCHLLQTPNSDGLSRNTSCIFQMWLFF